MNLLDGTLRRMVDGDNFILAEGNYNSSVHWGRIMTRADVKKNGIYVMSRW